MIYVCVISKGLIEIHLDVMILKRSPHYWIFLTRIFQSTTCFPHKESVMRSFDIYFKLKQTTCWTNGRCWWTELFSRSWEHRAMGLLPDTQNYGCACAGNAGNVFPSPQVSDPDMHHGTCVTHVPWCMPGSLTSGFLWSRRRGETFPAFPAHAQPAILRIWQEAHGVGVFGILWTLHHNIWPITTVHKWKHIKI